MNETNSSPEVECTQPLSSLPPSEKSRSIHSDYITVPDIEIDRGWSTSDVGTIDECDDAFAVLTAAVAEIQYQIDTNAITGERGDMWLANANRALRYKKAALSIVQQVRARINADIGRETQKSRDRKWIDFVKQTLPSEQWSALVSMFSSDGVPA